ncbi:MAG: ABC transporter ATP-binding protein [Ruminococcaceae bacterium]|nr:ABC transporter ATP-binding protein [Oscillospiraceae bacterium]
MKRKQTTSKKAAQVLGPLLRRHAAAYLLGLVTLFVVDYVNLFIPQYMGEVTDGLAANALDARGIFAVCAKIVLCGAVVLVGRFFWRYFIFGSARKIERELRDLLFAKLETLPQRYYHEHKTGDLMSYFTNDLEAVRQAIGPAVVTCFDSSVLTILVLYRMMVNVSVSLTLYTLIPMGVLAVFGYFFGEAIERRYAKMQKAFAELSDYVQESVSGERVVKAFVQEKKQAEAFRAVNDKKRRATLSVVRLDAAFVPALHFLVGLTYVVAIAVGGWYTMIGDMSLGDFVAFNMYIGSLVWPMLALGDSITLISQGIAGLGRLHEIMDERSEIVDDPQPDDVTHLTGQITIRNMSFAYQKGLPDALHGVDVEIAPGETLAVMGRTGAGKTTLVNLLCRVYDVTGGSIRFDGHDIRKLPLRVLHENIACVPQDNFLFSDTLAGNIAFGRPGATREQIEQAARDADIHDNIMDFPEGYDTMVGERGVTLSGGQKQRASIARALLKDSPILILDDSLSAVDTDTEETILENLKRVRRGKTTILIAHRVSTVQNADHVLVLDEGRVVEYGGHDELLAKENGVFATMWKKQQLEAQLLLED